MITVVNKDNAGLYSSYYEEVSNLLRQYNADGQPIIPGEEDKALIPMESVTFTSAEDYTPGLYYVKDDELGYIVSDGPYKSDETYFKSENITSLDEVFAYIADIAAIDKRYTRLPLDEPAFEIDLDKRTINVPNEFRTNGVAVQGDVIAETLYFVCPRFFDATDLGNSDKYSFDENNHPKAAYTIFIEWENALGEKGISRPWIHDIVSIPGKLIFGWPLCEKITKKAGTVKFAVRFYQENNGRISYSLSTQPTSITIKQSLGLDMNEPYIYCDDSDDILNRFENSPLVSGITTKADIPKLRNDIPLFNDMSKPDGDKKTIQAYNTDGGQISYRWSKKAIQPRIETENNMPPTEAQLKEVYPLQYKDEDCPGRNDERPAGTSLEAKYEIQYLDTKDKSRQPNKVYYINIGTELKPVYKTLEDSVVDFVSYAEENNSSVLEKFSTIFIDGVGVYQATISNRQRTSVETASTKMMRVEYPVKPVISAATGFVCREDEDGKIVAADGASAEAGAALSVTINQVAMVQDEDIVGDITYQWYKAPITSETIDSGDMVFEKLEGETDRILRPEEEGFYRLLITNSLNGEKDSFTTGAVRVMNTPSMPVIEYNENKPDELIFDKNAGDKLVISKVTIEELEGLISENSSDELKDLYGIDEILYQWYKYRKNAEDTEVFEADAQQAANGIFDINPINGHIHIVEELEGESSNSLDTTNLDSGYYFCVVTNKINGMETTRTSKFFSVISE